MIDRGMRGLLKLSRTEIERLFYGLRNDLGWQADPARVRKAILETLSLQLRTMAHFEILWNQIDLLDRRIDPPPKARRGRSR
jgi:hypothetical protein